MRRSVLANGLRVVTEERPGAPLAALKLFIKVGSRHDGDLPGVSHFVEHLLFQRSWPSGASPFARIEGVGGDVNAVTHRDYTALQAVVLARHVPLVLGAFAELVAPLEPRPDRLDREREVIIREIERSTDSQTVIWDLFLSALWGDDPLARPVYGSTGTIRALTGVQLEAHFERYLVPPRMVLAAAGALGHDDVAALAERHLSLPTRPRWDDAYPPPTRGPGRMLLEKDIQAVHLAVGVEAVGLADPRRPAVKILDILLGRGAHSRLHRRLRENRGLVYQVSTVAMAYEDRGYLCAYTSCAPEQIPDVTEQVLDEFARVGQEGIGEPELQRAKEQYEGALARHFETVLSLASVLGIEELLHHFEPFEESVAQVRRVTGAEVQTMARQMFDLERVAVAGVGRVQVRVP